MKDIHLAMPDELLVEITEASKRCYMSRSEYIRQVLYKEVGGKYRKAIDKIERDEIARFVDLDDS